MVPQDQGGKAVFQLPPEGRAAGGPQVYRIQVVPLPVGQKGGVQMQNVDPVLPMAHVDAGRVRAACCIDRKQGACHGAVAAEALQQWIQQVRMLRQGVCIIEVCAAYLRLVEEGLHRVRSLYRVHIVIARDKK